MKKIEAQLFIADRRINNFMKGLDLRHDGQWYVKSQIVTFTTSSEVNENYFSNIIEESYLIYNISEENGPADFWIPAISYEIFSNTRFRNNLISHKSVLEISDGNGIIFLTENLPTK